MCKCSQPFGVMDRVVTNCCAAGTRLVRKISTSCGNLLKPACKCLSVKRLVSSRGTSELQKISQRYSVGYCEGRYVGERRGKVRESRTSSIVSSYVVRSNLLGRELLLPRQTARTLSG